MSVPEKFIGRTVGPEDRMATILIKLIDRSLSHVPVLTALHRLPRSETVFDQKPWQSSGYSGTSERGALRSFCHVQRLRNLPNPFRIVNSRTC